MRARIGADNPLRWQFDDIHHPSYREFVERVLAHTRDPAEAWDLFLDDFAHRPDFVHRYRHAFGFHGAHPFFLWNQSLVPRRHLGRIIVAGVEDPAVAARFGVEGFRTLAAALESVAADYGRGFSIAHKALPPVVIARVGGGA